MSVVPQNATNQISVSAEANEYPELEIDKGWTWWSKKPWLQRAKGKGSVFQFTSSCMLVCGLKDTHMISAQPTWTLDVLGEGN